MFGYKLIAKQRRFSARKREENFSLYNYIGRKQSRSISRMYNTRTNLLLFLSSLAYIFTIDLGVAKLVAIAIAVRSPNAESGGAFNFRLRSRSRCHQYSV